MPTEDCASLEFLVAQVQCMIPGYLWSSLPSMALDVHTVDQHQVFSFVLEIVLQLQCFSSISSLQTFLLPFSALFQIHCLKKKLIVFACLYTYIHIYISIIITNAVCIMILVYMFSGWPLCAGESFGMLSFGEEHLFLSQVLLGCLYLFLCGGGLVAFLCPPCVQWRLILHGWENCLFSLKSMIKVACKY